LLHLHKALLHFEQKQYEGKYGKISSPAKLFELVTGNSSFSWLRSLSELIVALDEITESEGPVKEKDLQSMLEYSQKLLTASERGNTFSKNYFFALQKDPAVAIMHGRVSKLISTCLE